MKTTIDKEFGGRYVEIPWVDWEGKNTGPQDITGPTEITDGNSLAKFLLNDDDIKIAIWRHKMGIPSNLPNHKFNY